MKLLVGTPGFGIVTTVLTAGVSLVTLVVFETPC
jgi:hypothetical protein